MKNITGLVLMAALVVLLSSPSLGMAAGKGKPARAKTAPVDLGSAGSFVILSETGISTTTDTTIVGDIGVSPIAATGITGFGLIMDPSGQFSTSTLVVGKVYAADYAVPTPATMTTAVGDMETAYTDATLVGRALAQTAVTLQANAVIEPNVTTKPKKGSKPKKDSRAEFVGQNGAFQQ